MSHGTGYVDCYCGNRAVIRTSWTDGNPGRRFQSCLNYDKGGCSFFSWEDPPIVGRARTIIPGLLKKINIMKEELTKLEEHVVKLEVEVEKLQEQVVKLKAKNRRLVFIWMSLFVLICCLIWTTSQKSMAVKVEKRVSNYKMIT